MNSNENDDGNPREHRAGRVLTKSEHNLHDVLDEIDRAKKISTKWPTDVLHALAVLQEEIGELTKHALQFTYEPHKTTRESLRKQAVQVAVMVLRFLDSVDSYTFTASEMHDQGKSE